MKVIIKAPYRNYSKKKPNDCWQIWLKHGVQSFQLSYTGTWEECRWFANQVRHALREACREEMKKV